MAEKYYELKTPNGKWGDLRFYSFLTLPQLNELESMALQTPDSSPHQPMLNNVVEIFKSFPVRKDNRQALGVGYWNPYRFKDIPIKIDANDNDLPPQVNEESLGWLALLKLEPFIKPYLAWLDENENTFHCTMSWARKWERQNSARSQKEVKYNDVFPSRRAIEKLIKANVRIVEEDADECLAMDGYVVYVPEEGFLDNQNMRRGLNFARVHPTLESAQKKASNHHRVLKVNLQIKTEEIDLSQSYGVTMDNALAKKKANQEAKELRDEFQSVPTQRARTARL